MKHNLMRNVLLAAIAALAAVGLTACSDDDYSGTPYFYIDGNEAGMSDTVLIAYDGIDTTSFTQARKLNVRSNRPWRLVEESADATPWVRVFPEEGEMDGIVRVSAAANAAPSTRTKTYHVYLDGKDCGKTIVVKETGAEPYLRGSANNINIARVGGDVQFTVTTNVDYAYSIVGEGSDWLTVNRSTDDPNVLIINAAPNTTGNERSATLHLQGTGDYSNLVIDVPITQLYALYFENFSWMGINGVDGRTGLSVLGWETSGESFSRFDKWTDEELAHGWESRSTLCYGRPGFIKLGKTNYGGDVISPKFSEIVGTIDVDVSVQVVGYASAKGAVDDQDLYIAIIGPGKITSLTCGGPSNGSCDLGIDVNYVDENGNAITIKDGALIVLDSDNHFNKTTDPTGLEIWQEPNTNYTFTITGATSETRVLFMGGVYNEALKSVGSGKNRIFLDNFKVVQR